MLKVFLQHPQSYGEIQLYLGLESYLWRNMLSFRTYINMFSKISNIYSQKNLSKEAVNRSHDSNFMKCDLMTYLLVKSVVVTACLLSLFETGRKKKKNQIV